MSVNKIVCVKMFCNIKMNAPNDKALMDDTCSMDKGVATHAKFVY